MSSFKNRAKALAKQQTQNGALFLDSKIPGWAHRVDLEVFDVSDVFGRCIASLATGTRTFGVACQVLGLNRSTMQSVHHGFNVRKGGPVTYSHLNAAWRPLIEARRAA